MGSDKARTPVHKNNTNSSSHNEKRVRGGRVKNLFTAISPVSTANKTRRAAKPNVKIPPKHDFSEADATVAAGNAKKDELTTSVTAPTEEGAAPTSPDAVLSAGEEEDYNVSSTDKIDNSSYKTNDRLPPLLPSRIREPVRYLLFEVCGNIANKLFRDAGEKERKRIMLLHQLNQEPLDSMITKVEKQREEYETVANDRLVACNAREGQLRRIKSENEKLKTANEELKAEKEDLEAQLAHIVGGDALDCMKKLIKHIRGLGGRPEDAY